RSNILEQDLRAEVAWAWWVTSCAQDRLSRRQPPDRTCEEEKIMNVRQTRIVTSVSRRPSNGLPAVDIATTRGTASPSACAHATTMTVTVRSTATSRLVP